MEFIEESGIDTVRIKLVGEATIYQALDLKKHLVAALRKTETLEADLNCVTEMDTSCVQILLLLSKESARGGKTFRVTGLSQTAQETLKIFGLHGYLKQDAIE